MLRKLQTKKKLFLLQLTNLKRKIMASNVVLVNVYQINQKAPLTSALTMAFPATGCLLQDCSSSPTRSLSTGVNVYSSISIPSSNLNGSGTALFYCRETISQLATLFNA